MAPEIAESTREERESYIKERFACRANCESCGLCKVYKGVSPEIVYAPYIEGKESFLSIASRYR